MPLFTNTGSLASSDCLIASMGIAGLAPNLRIQADATHLLTGLGVLRHHLVGEVGVGKYLLDIIQIFERVK